MKRLALVLSLLALTHGILKSQSEETGLFFKLTDIECFSQPISPLLYGNFIELGYGLQVESMWSEMFFNRSFEPFSPYKAINKAWFDLYNDERDPAKGYERDWSGFDWYHSGY